MQRKEGESRIPTFRKQCFHYGAGEVIRALRIEGYYADYKFVDFDERVTDKISLCQFAHKHRNNKCVLISSERLLPLTRFYFHHFGFVTTVIRANESLKSTIEWLKLINGIKRLKPDLYGSHSLTYTEACFLGEFLAGKSIYKISVSLNKNSKTVYHYRKTIARKMGLKRLENLLIPGVKNTAP